MSFSTFLDQAWSDHGKDAAGVAERLKSAQTMIASEEELAQFAGLASHVIGEHLGQWDRGLQLFNELKSHSSYSAGRESGRAVERAIRAFELSSGQDVDLNSLELSDRVRVLAVAASALSDKETARATQFLRTALKLAETKLSANDPANRSLAVTGNNLASTLSEKQNRTADETSLMILCAQTARIYWERAGTWVHVMRAEYRLALTFLAMKDFERARRHADICKTMCFENNADTLDKFFAFEAIALIETAAGEREELALALTQAGNYFEQLSDDDKAWCKPILDKLILS